MACCYAAGGCCDPQGYKDRTGTYMRRLDSCEKGSLLMDGILKWDRNIFDSETVRKFHVDHPVICMPLSITRFAVRTATAPLIALISTIVMPIIALFAKDPNKYLGAFCWAAWKTIVLASIICICAFGISQSKMIILVGIYGGLGALGEIISTLNLREHGKNDHKTDFPLQQTFNESRSGLFGLAFKYLFA